MAKHDAMKGYMRGYKAGPTSSELARKEPGQGGKSYNRGVEEMAPAKKMHSHEYDEHLGGGDPITDKMGHGGHHTQVQGFGGGKSSSHFASER